MLHRELLSHELKVGFQPPLSSSLSLHVPSMHVPSAASTTPEIRLSIRARWKDDKANKQTIRSSSCGKPKCDVSTFDETDLLGAQPEAWRTPATPQSVSAYQTCSTTQCAATHQQAQRRRLDHDSLQIPGAKTHSPLNRLTLPPPQPL
eukprot:2719842-Rhodomonas_salina.4